MCLQINKRISPKLVANYFPRRFRPTICAANSHTFQPRHEKEAKVKLSMAKHNKITKPLKMWPIGSKIIAQVSKYEVMIGQNRRSFLC